MKRLALFVALAIIWLLLTWSLDGQQLITGLVLSVVVVALSAMGGASVFLVNVRERRSEIGIMTIGRYNKL